MLQLASYLTIGIYASSSVAIARDIAFARGTIYDCKTFMEQATTDIVTFDILFSYSRNLRP